MARATAINISQERMRLPIHRLLRNRISRSTAEVAITVKIPQESLHMASQLTTRSSTACQTHRTGKYLHNRHGLTSKARLLTRLIILQSTNPPTASTSQAMEVNHMGVPKIMHRLRCPSIQHLLNSLHSTPIAEITAIRLRHSCPKRRSLLLRIKETNTTHPIILNPNFSPMHHTHRQHRLHRPFLHLATLFPLGNLPPHPDDTHNKVEMHPPLIVTVRKDFRLRQHNHRAYLHDTPRMEIRQSPHLGHIVSQLFQQRRILIIHCLRRQGHRAQHRLRIHLSELIPADVIRKLDLCLDLLRSPRPTMTTLGLQGIAKRRVRKQDQVDWMIS